MSFLFTKDIRSARTLGFFEQPSARIDKIEPLSTIEAQAEVAELADAGDSKSPGVSPRVGSTPTFGTAYEPGSLPAPAFSLWSRVANAGLIFLFFLFSRALIL